MEGRRQPGSMQKCLYLSKSERDICGFTDTCSSTAHSQRVAGPEPEVGWRRKEEERRASGEREREGGGEKEPSYSCSVGSAH